MSIDLSQEITQQLNFFISLMPKIEELNNLLNNPIVSDDMIEEFRNIPPAKKDEWVQKNINRINLNQDPNIERLMTEIKSDMDTLFGQKDDQMQSLLATQHQQSLKAAQKPQNKSYGIDQQD